MAERFPDISEDDIFTAFRAFIIYAINPSGVITREVIRTPVNRAAMPKGAFVALSPSEISPFSTNVIGATDTDETVTRNSKYSIQVDVYGESSWTYATTIAILMRHKSATEQMSTLGVYPLYAGDIRQMPIVDGEEQYQERWSFDAIFQINPTISIPLAV